MFTSVQARMAKPADALDLGSSAARHGGSTPSPRIAIFVEWELNLSEVRSLRAGVAVNSEWPTPNAVKMRGAQLPLLA